MESEIKKIAVIGAGPCGLVCLKTLLENNDNNYEVSCFEATSDVGGMWNYASESENIPYEFYSDNEKFIRASYQHLKTNVSGYGMMFSDFIGKNVKIGSKHLKRQEYLEYLKEYTENFNLKKYIKFNCLVEMLEKDRTNWNLYYMNKETKNKEKSVFNYIVMAGGLFMYPNIPKLKNQEHFNGLIMHSSQVRNEELLFKDKTVFIIGGGVSALEIGAEALRYGCKKVYANVTRYPNTQSVFATGYRVLDEDGTLKPYDLINRRSLYHERRGDYAKLFKSWFTVMYNHNKEENNPIPVLWKDMVALADFDTIKEYIQLKKYEVVASIEDIKDENLILKDGSVIKNVDVIVLGTGFKSKYPMLDGIWTEEEQEACLLYNYMIPIEKKLDGIVFMLTRNFFMPLMQLMDIQSRWIKEKIITKDCDENGILYNDEERKRMELSLKEQMKQKLNSNCNYVPCFYDYMDGLAKDIERMPPDYKDIAKSDPELAVALKFGPMLSAHYRLVGNDAWTGAREFLINATKEIFGDKFNALFQELP